MKEWLGCPLLSAIGVLMTHYRLRFFINFLRFGISCLGGRSRYINILSEFLLGESSFNGKQGDQIQPAGIEHKEGSEVRPIKRQAKAMRFRRSQSFIRAKRLISYLWSDPPRSQGRGSIQLLSFLSYFPLKTKRIDLLDRLLIQTMYHRTALTMLWNKPGEEPPESRRGGYGIPPTTGAEVAQPSAFGFHREILNTRES